MIYTYYQLGYFFLIYSFLGWCAGVVMNAVQKRKFVNTGFMGLPFCPSYGIGAVGFCIFLAELREHLFFLFLGGAIIGTLVCILTGIILEHIFHRKWWDYSKNRFQFEGYVSLWHLIVFGISAVFMLCIFNPLLIQILAWLPFMLGNIILLVGYCLLGIDFIMSVIAVWELKVKIHRLESLSENMQKVTDEFGNVLTGRIQKRMMRSYSNLEAGKIKESEKKKENKKCFAEGCCFYKLVCLFFIGAFLGDVVETIFCRITMGSWLSRSSVVYGPFSIVWGFGCTMLTALLYKYKDESDRYIFTIGTVLGGTYEYICSVFTELVFGTVFWDYSDIPFNIGGRINLLYCFFWGIVAVIWIKNIYPKLSSLIEKLPIKLGTALTWFGLLFMIFNVAISGLALARYSQRQENVISAKEKMQRDDTCNSQIEAFLDKHFDDERMEGIYPNAVIVEE